MKTIRRMASTLAYESFLTAKSLRREPSAIRALQPLVSLPGMISLGGGMPNPSTFPFHSIALGLKNGQTLELSTKEVEQALQYSPTPGLPELVGILMNMMDKEHNPPRGNMKRSMAITTGSQDALSKALDLLIDQDDNLLIESPTYSGTLAHLHAVGCKLAPIKTDAQGLIPEDLDKVLKQWDTMTMGKRPRVLYTIPTGGNPTGVSMTFERKKKVYEIASRPENNLIILEDDPYYYLQLGQTRTRSIFHIDTDTRVLRFDSFSKILSSGLRVGTVVGPDPLINRLNLHTQSANLHSSGISQAAVLALLKSWGQEGWDSHLVSVNTFYRKQRDAFEKSMQRHLKDLADWNVPNAGMFVWINLRNITDSKTLIEQNAVKEKILLVPGEVFLPTKQKTSFVRAAYSTATYEEMDTAMQRLATLLKNETSQ